MPKNGIFMKKYLNQMQYKPYPYHYSKIWEIFKIDDFLNKLTV